MSTLLKRFIIFIFSILIFTKFLHAQPILEWDVSENAAYYQVYYSEHEEVSSFNNLTPIRADTNSLDIATIDFECNKTYYFRIKACNACEQCSEPSDSVLHNVINAVVVLPSIPSGLTLTF